MELKMNYNDNELRALLAKMLPETVHLSHSGELCWSHNYSQDSHLFVLNTELLHLASLVEAGLNYEESHNYLDALARIVDPIFGYRNELTLGIITATWQQRTRALAKVKGVAL